MPERFGQQRERSFRDHEFAFADSVTNPHAPFMLVSDDHGAALELLRVDLHKHDGVFSVLLHRFRRNQECIGFRLRIQADGSLTAETVNATNITNIKPLFSPGKEFKKALNNAEFQKVG